jgi:excinuclease ABC subunit C
MSVPSSPEINTKLANLPSNPGIYQFFNRQGQIIYIGKAKNLRNRVRSYFREHIRDPKILTLRSQIFDIQWIISESEINALLLENILIKEHSPRYNVMLKDDKSFPYLQISNELFPRIFVTRKPVRDGSRYLGPYTDTRHLRKTLKTIHRLFPLRSCSHRFTPEMIEQKKVPLCLEYHLKNCEGPCQNLVKSESYRAMIEKIVRFLNGHTKEILQELNEQMMAAAKNLEFEEAARIRDQIAILNEYSNQQTIVQTDFENRDLIAIAATENDAAVILFRVREGKLIGREHFYLKQTRDQSRSDLAKHFIRGYYQKTTLFPKEVFAGIESELALYEDFLSHLAGHRVKIIQPERGAKAKLWTLAQKNADMLLKELLLQKMKLSQKPAKVVEALQQSLQLAVPPLRIEGFDISNIQGEFPVASMVVFENGQPAKKAYRKFIIKTVEGPNDFASMQEVIERRYSRLLREKESLPDLVLIDGGKGQLNAAKEILDKLGLQHLPVLGLAKRLEEVFIPGYSTAQNIPKNSPALALLKRVRDEAHRFAITFHRQRRDEAMVQTILDDIPGVGPKRRNLLLKNYGSPAELLKASPKSIAENCKIPLKLSQQILQALQEKNLAIESENQENDSID